MVSRARTRRNVLTHLPPEQAAEALNEEFPWLALLPESDLPLFVRDFVKAVQISAELARWGVLAQTLREWKATAAVYADPALTRDFARPLADDHGPVPGPEE